MNDVQHNHNLCIDVTSSKRYAYYNQRDCDEYDDDRTDDPAASGDRGQSVAAGRLRENRDIRKVSRLVGQLATSGRGICFYLRISIAVFWGFNGCRSGLVLRLWDMCGPVRLAFLPSR